MDFSIPRGKQGIVPVNLMMFKASTKPLPPFAEMLGDGAEQGVCPEDPPLGTLSSLILTDCGYKISRKTANAVVQVRPCGQGWIPSL